MNKFTKFLYAFIMVVVFTMATTFAQCPNGTYVDILIVPDQYPEETSWAVLKDNGDTLVSGGPYTNIIDYSPQNTQICIPNGDYTFEIYDSYGDGMAGSLWGGNDGAYYIMQCNDTIVASDVADFGFEAFEGFTIENCAPPPPIYGCMDFDYVEFLPVATVDTGMCFTPKVYGCTDSTAFNYVDSANTDILTDSCTYNLTLTDLAGNGWAGSYVLVFQGNNFLGNYTLLNGFDTTYTFELSIGEPVGIKFEITQQSDFTAVQCGYSLYSEEAMTMYEPGGFANPLVPFQINYGIPYCGNNCIEKTYGCTDSLAINYNDTVNTDDGTCYFNPGCTNPLYLEYDASYDYDNGSCSTMVVYGCMDSTALNYDSLANIELPNSCIAIVEGCMNPLAYNYNPNANVQDTCIAVVEGCTNPTALNFDITANTDDNSCVFAILGCTDVDAFNYNPLANTDDGSCIEIVYGCMDQTMFNFNPLANVDNGSCEPFVYGCMDSTAFNFNATANVDNGSCVEFIYGCTDPAALNYNPDANTEDFSCIDYFYGCTDSTAMNYEPLANTDNGSCIYPFPGCMDYLAVNFEPLANVNDSSCYYNSDCETNVPYYIPNACFEWVIQVDPYCCDDEWDNPCQELYVYCQDGWTGPTDIAMFERLGVLPYPNPSTGVVNFTDEVNIKVYNVLGKLVLEDKTNKIELSKGVYLIKISKDNLDITTKLIIE